MFFSGDNVSDTSSYSSLGEYSAPFYYSNSTVSAIETRKSLSAIVTCANGGCNGTTLLTWRVQLSYHLNVSKYLTADLTDIDTNYVTKDLTRNVTRVTKDLSVDVTKDLTVSVLHAPTMSAFQRLPRHWLPSQRLPSTGRWCHIPLTVHSARIEVRLYKKLQVVKDLTRIQYGFPFRI